MASGTMEVVIKFSKEDRRRLDKFCKQMEKNAETFQKIADQIEARKKKCLNSKTPKQNISIPT